jgi:hypothetical protein
MFPFVESSFMLALPNGVPKSTAGLFLIGEKTQDVFSPDSRRSSTKPPLPVVLGASKSRVNLASEVFARLFCFPAEDVDRLQAVIILSLYEEYRSLRLPHGSAEAARKLRISGP